MKGPGTILLSTGGTGGHVFPALRLGQELRDRGYRVLLLTDQRGQKYQENSQFDGVIILNLHKGAGLFSKIRQLFDVGIGTLKTLGLLRREGVRLVVGFGGYTSVPAMVAAFLSKIPLVVHEQNAVLGRVNRRMAKVARFVALGFEKTLHVPAYCKSLFVGNPVRDEILRLGQSKTQKAKNTDKGTGKINLFVFGGSQGAAIFSDVVPKAMELLPRDLQSQVEIVHQATDDRVEQVRHGYARTAVQVDVIEPFFRDMPERLRQADLIICRAGAMTVAEAAIVGRACIFVPLKIAMDNHQYYNAKDICDNGAGVMILQDDFTPPTLAGVLDDLIRHPEKRQKMGAQIQGFAKGDASQVLANEIDNLLAV